MDAKKILGEIGEIILDEAVCTTSLCIMDSLCPVRGAMNATKALKTVGKYAISYAMTKQTMSQIKRDLASVPQKVKSPNSGKDKVQS